MFISIVTIRFTTAGSKVVHDIYYNYIFTLQVLQEFLMMRCTSKLVYLWEDAFVGRTHRNISQDCSRALTRPQELLVAYKLIHIITP